MKSPLPTFSDSIHELFSPPKPPLALRVGVVGHRPNRLENAHLEKLGAVIREILEAVQAGVHEAAETHRHEFAPDAPVLRAVSPLAEGTDRLFADQALALGWDLCCVMPFPREEYEKDFVGDVALETDSLERFRKFLDTGDPAKRPTWMELDGSRVDQGLAYGTGGSVVLGLSDLLIAVWDGDRARDKQGGTAGTMAEAQRSGTPVVLVDAQAPHAWRLIGSAENDLAAVRKVVGNALSLPGAKDYELRKTARRKQESSLEGLLKYNAETRPRWNVAVLWKTFRNVVADLKFSVASCKLPPFEESVLDDCWSI